MKAGREVMVGREEQRNLMLRSKSLPHVDLKRFKLFKQSSNVSQLSQVRKLSDIFLQYCFWCLKGVNGLPVMLYSVI